MTLGPISNPENTICAVCRIYLLRGFGVHDERGGWRCAQRESCNARAQLPQTMRDAANAARRSAVNERHVSNADAVHDAEYMQAEFASVPPKVRSTFEELRAFTGALVDTCASCGCEQDPEPCPGPKDKKDACLIREPHRHYTCENCGHRWSSILRSERLVHWC